MARIYRPRSERLARVDYLDNAHLFAHKTPKKLTIDDVIRIRENRHGKTDRWFADALGVSENTIYRVRNYLTWRHVS